MRLLLGLALALVLAAPASAQERANDEPRPSPNAMVSQTVGTTVLTVTYGRPSVKDRLAFGAEADGALAPYGAVWRTGANEAATITLTDSVLVEGQPLAPGTYGLFTVPGEDAWEVVFNRVANQWGAFRYSVGDDALRVRVTPTEGAAHQEAFLIAFDPIGADAATLVLAWDDVRVPMQIRTAD